MIVRFARYALCALLASCTAVREGELGSDQPRLQDEPDAMIQSPELPEPAVDSAPSARSDASPADAARPAPAPAPASDAGRPELDEDAGTNGCMLAGHLLPELPLPSEWDGGRPPPLLDDPLLDDPLKDSLLGDPLSPVLPLGFDAGVPQFCCTPLTPLHCKLP